MTETAMRTVMPAEAPDSGEPIWFLRNLAKVLVPAEAGYGMSIVDITGPEGDQPPLHLHRNDDEGFYVVEGRLTLWAGKERIELEAGGFYLTPRGVPHTYRVESELARWLAISSDASFDRFVRAYGRPAPEELLPGPSEPDLGRLEELAAEHGIEILGPPGTLPV